MFRRVSLSAEGLPQDAPEVYFGGLGHGFADYPNGTAAGWTDSWAGWARRGPVRFRMGHSGQLVPEDRGRRRAMALSEFGTLIAGLLTPEPERPGPKSPRPGDGYEEVEELLTARHTSRSACMQLAMSSTGETHLDFETQKAADAIRRRYQRERKRRRARESETDLRSRLRSWSLSSNTHAVT